MSDTSTIPFSPTTSAPGAAEPEVAGAIPQRRLLLLGGVAAAAVLAVAAYFLLFAGGGAPAPVGSAPAPVASPSAAAPAPAQETPQPPVERSLKARNFGTDPFKPLVQEAAAGTTGGTGTTGTPAGTTAGSTGTAATGGATGGTGAPATGGVVAPTPTASHSFRVLSVAPDNSSVVVNVDGKRYNNLKAGEVFATYFKVVLISGATNTFQYGDEKFNVLGTKRLTIA